MLGLVQHLKLYISLDVDFEMSLYGYVIHTLSTAYCTKSEIFSLALIGGLGHQTGPDDILYIPDSTENLRTFWNYNFNIYITYMLTF